ncbi:MAG: DUF2156 domain-containing protein [Gemmatimonadaceae bacterium]
MTSEWPANVRRVRELVLEHGWNATSYQVVNPGISHWFSAAEDAVVGYVEYAGIRVVAGAPVCAPDQLQRTVLEFETDSRRGRAGVCYFGAESRLENLLANSSGHAGVVLGAQPSWHPADWSEILANHSSLRAQLNRASNKGVMVEEYSSTEARSEPELEDVLARWLKGRGLPPLHFLVEPKTLDRLVDRRIFVARQTQPEGAARIVAFAILSPIPARNGWLVEQFPRLPDAPNGTIELLLASAVNAIAASGSDYVTLGLAPLARRRDFSPGSDPAWLRAALGFAGVHGSRFYNFRGLEAFKEKFRPRVWEPIYAIQSEPRFSPRALYAIAGAFASRSPISLAAGVLAGAVVQEVRWLSGRKH